MPLNYCFPGLLLLQIAEDLSERRNTGKIKALKHVPYIFIFSLSYWVLSTLIMSMKTVKFGSQIETFMIFFDKVMHCYYVQSVLMLNCAIN